MGFFRDKWIDEMSLVLKNTTNLSSKQIKSFLEKKYDEHFVDTEAILYNSYDKIATPTSLSDVLDWIQIRKPIVTEAGTFFKRVDEGRALHAQIVFGNLMNRDVHKKLMFSALDRLDMVTAKFEDAMQLLEKLRSNAPYGVDGNPYSFSYSYNVSSTTTFSARGQTSVATLNFENIMNDFVKFDSMEEMFFYINNIIREKDEWKFKTFDVVDILPSVKDCVQRIINKFEIGVEYDEPLIWALFKNMTESERTRIFYKSNIRAFMLNEKIAKLIDDISLNDDILFQNPYTPEEEIKAELRLIGELVVEFVGYKHQTFRYEDKTRHKKRATAIVIDTDSTNLYVGNLVKFLKKNVLTKRFFLTMEQYNNYDIKLKNILAHYLTQSISETLDFYLNKINVDNGDKRVKMKNEFDFGLMITTLAKKAYMASVFRREGVVFSKPKIEMKGVTFNKSSATPKTTEFIIGEILKKRLFFTNNGKIDLFEILETIQSYKEQMRKEIISGDLSYYKRAVKVKAGYTDAMAQQQYKATYLWNMICHPDDKIELPATVTLIKTKIYSKKDLALLEDYPEIYNKFMKFIEEEGDRKVAIAIKNDKNKPDAKNYKGVSEKEKERIRNSVAITSIALPNTYDAMPEWLHNIIDVETIISNNMTLFEQLYKPLNLAPVEPRHQKTKKNLTYYTNIVRVG